MYVEVAHYTLGTGTVDELRQRVEQGPVKVMRDAPGFVEYYAFDAGDGSVASVAVFTDQACAEAATEKLGAWIEETVATFDISPGHMSGGEVFATTRS